MDGTLDFANDSWGRTFNPNNATQTFLGMPKVRAWSIFTLPMPYVKTLQIQNLALL